MSDAATFACAPLDSCLNFVTHCSARFRVNMDTVLTKIVEPSGLGPLGPDEVPTVSGRGRANTSVLGFPHIELT